MDPPSRRVPTDKRKRTESSCDLCKSRKHKCERVSDQDSCKYCESQHRPCTTTVPRKRRLYGSAENVGNRITLLESLVKGLVPEADIATISGLRGTGESLGIPLPQVDDDGAVHKEPAKQEEGGLSELQVIPDAQKQMQYVGPSSSFLFHVNLRRLLGNYQVFEFALFGNNAADQVWKSPGGHSDHTGPKGISPQSSTAAASDCGSPVNLVKEIDGSVLESLLDAYFETFHPDFPVLHETSFRDRYESWCGSSSSSEPVWLCTVLCVLILARRVVPLRIPEEAQKKWWVHVQMLLPTVFFSSDIHTVQALMLAALHLHNTNSRDACWNLTGTAVRVAHAIGLHRDDIKPHQSRLVREHRKQIWWTLYALEQMQVSSYDRPSAIARISSSVGWPNERILGAIGPPGFNKWHQKLQVILGSACGALNPEEKGGLVRPEDALDRPLSPTAAVLRDLNRWKESLPSHLQVDAAGWLAPSVQRPLLLLYIEYYYVVIMLTRSALLRRAVFVAHEPATSSLPPALLTVSETCIDAGKSMAELLRKLDSIQRFNAVTWFDIFFTVASALVLVLDIRANLSRESYTSEPRTILAALATLTARQLKNPNVPGSMHALGKIVIDVSAAASFPASEESSVAPDLHSSTPQAPSAHLGSGGPASSTGYNLGQAGFGMQNGAQLFEPQVWDQLSFLDQFGNGWQDWTWDDIGMTVRQ